MGGWSVCFIVCGFGGFPKKSCIWTVSLLLSETLLLLYGFSVSLIVKRPLLHTTSGYKQKRRKRKEKWKIDEDNGN